MKKIAKNHQNVVRHADKNGYNGHCNSNGSKSTGDINSVVGIHIGTKSLYWVKVDRHRNVIEWSNADLFPTVDAGRKMTLPKLFALMDGMAENIPFSDVFVLETPHQRVLSSVSSPAVIANAIFRSQILAILLTILNLRLENEDATEEYYHKVFLLKQRTVSRFFNLLVGSERVSALALVDFILGIKASHNAADLSEIMDENSQEGNQSMDMSNSRNPLISPVNASSSIIESYRALEPVERESMSQALLSALAFYDLVVFKNPKVVDPL
ncbi:uncharacterized protein LOC124169770 isoform X2 [Ischnura elegans]|uniref:uncharacterized protein LOC124169770 isoform X2 n=1 Tax=Ischnura elegans TaxID=197161 RepID=UPI001ED86741|nr:uncharacterized protein LOC124169770 isoform X2 [Ischnura elegans]